MTCIKVAEAPAVEDGDIESIGSAGAPSLQGKDVALAQALAGLTLSVGVADQLERLLFMVLPGARRLVDSRAATPASPSPQWSQGQ